jgi:hypothetical protein
MLGMPVAMDSKRDCGERKVSRPEANPIDGDIPSKLPQWKVTYYKVINGKKQTPFATFVVYALYDEEAIHEAIKKIQKLPKSSVIKRRLQAEDDWVTHVELLSP